MMNSTDLLSWLRRHRIDVALVAFLCVFSLVSRLITLEPVELSGDPLDYWYFVKQWFYGGEFGKFDHHDARFGIHLWLFAVQLFLGESAEYTYIAPLAVQTVVVALSYVLTRQISTRAAGIVVALALCEYDEFIRASSQIRPGMFSAMYLLAVAISLVFYARAKPEKRFVPLAAVVVSLLLSYLAWDPNVFYTPAVLLVMYLTQRRKKDVLYFGGFLLCGFLAESALHYVMVGGTRISSSLGRGSGPTLPVYGDVTLRLTRYLHDSGKLVFYGFFVSGPALLALTVRDKKLAVALPIVLLPACFLLFVTFAVRSLNPVVAVMPLHPRYLNGAVPFAVIATVVLMQSALERLTFSSSTWSRALSPALSGIVALAIFSYQVSDLRRLRLAQAGQVHPFVQARRAFATISDAYARGLPIVGPADKLLGKKRFPRSPPLHWAYKGFVRSDLLVREDGKLPRFDYRKMTAPLSRGSRTVFLPRRLDAGAVQLASRRHCAVRLIRNDRFVTVVPAEGTLPAECEALPERKKKKAKKASSKKGSSEKSPGKKAVPEKEATQKAAP